MWMTGQDPQYRSRRRLWEGGYVEICVPSPRSRLRLSANIKSDQPRAESAHDMLAQCCYLIVYLPEATTPYPRAYLPCTAACRTLQGRGLFQTPRGDFPPGSSGKHKFNETCALATRLLSPDSNLTPTQCYFICALDFLLFLIKNPNLQPEFETNLIQTHIQIVNSNYHHGISKVLS